MLKLFFKNKELFVQLGNFVVIAMKLFPQCLVAMVQIQLVKKM